MSNFNRNDEVNNASTCWNRCKRKATGLYGQAIWILVPFTLYVCALLPVDTFVPTQRSTKRPAALPISKQEAEAIRNETKRLIESLMAREHRLPEYEGKLKVRTAPEEITAIENYVGTRLPEDFRFFLERFDGLETGNSYRSIQWLTPREMLSYSSESTAIYSDHVQAPQTLPGVSHHPALIVIDDIRLGVDAFTGIIYEWDPFGGQLVQVAPSFRALLRALDEQMERGEKPKWRNLKFQ